MSKIQKKRSFERTKNEMAICYYGLVIIIAIIVLFTMLGLMKNPSFEFLFGH